MTTSSDAFVQDGRARLLPLLVAALVVGTAFFRIHIRSQTTLLGYEIGRLKETESTLLEERGVLRVQLSKLTTRGHLKLISDSGGEAPHGPAGTLAQNE